MVEKNPGRSCKLAPSILSADMARLGEEVDKVVEAGADFIHFDVMDNHYVPNLSFGPVICQALTRYGVSVPIDVHLMVEPVDDLIERFADAGASYITIHPEASRHVDRSLQLIRDKNCKPGLALNPGTPLSTVEHYWQSIDMLLLMSVNPGFGGQKFIPYVKQKISAAREQIDARGLATLIEVDGGIKTNNIGELAALGAEVFVSGSGVFGTEDYAQTLQEMRREITEHCA